MAQADTNQTRRVARGPGLIIALAIGLVAVVMLIAMAVAQPWNSGDYGDPSGDAPRQEQRAPR